MIIFVETLLDYGNDYMESMVSEAQMPWPEFKNKEKFQSFMQDWLENEELK